MHRRKRVLGTVLLLLGVPAALAVTEAARYQVRNRNTGFLVSSGQRREYLLHVPPSYDGTRPVPLVLSLHGGATWPAAQQQLSRWNEVADEQGFLVAYPSGTRSPRLWHAMRPGEGLTADVRFIAELIESLRSEYNVDPARIYADGLSNGAGMAFVLSCTLSDRIAAVGMVASAHFLPWSWCRDQRAVPMIAFHGTEDPIAPYRGGRSWVSPDRFAEITTWTANWARRNRCAASPVESVAAAGVIRREYTGCAGEAGVVLYTLLGGGHTWPGGMPLPEWFAGRTSRAIEATREIWAFFREHPLRTAPADLPQEVEADRPTPAPVGAGGRSIPPRRGR